MARVEAEFRRLAEECVRLAQRTDVPQEKLLLLDMAQAWLTLANNTERLDAAEQDDQPGGSPAG